MRFAWVDVNGCASPSLSARPREEESKDGAELGNVSHYSGPNHSVGRRLDTGPDRSCPGTGQMVHRRGVRPPDPWPETQCLLHRGSDRNEEGGKATSAQAEFL